MDVLQLDVSGRPQAWLSAKEAAALYANDSVAWTLGDPFLVLRGGIQRRTGLQSRLELHPIVAVHGSIPSRAWRQRPALSNPKLFARDRFICNGNVYSSIPIQPSRYKTSDEVRITSTKPIRASGTLLRRGPRISLPSVPRGRRPFEVGPKGATQAHAHEGAWS